MRKNVAGQKIGAQMVSATDGAAFVGAVTVYVTIDAGTQAIGTVGSGAATDEGNGYYTYAPSQAETNGDLLAYTFVGTGAVPVTVQAMTIDAIADLVNPAQSGDWSITRTFQVSGGDKVSGVRMSLVGVGGKTDTTGTDGIATIKADDGTFTLRVVVPAGYEDVADSSVTINGADSTATVTLTATNVAPPSDPALSTLQVLCLDASGAPEEGVLVDARIVTVPTGSTNTAFRGNKQTATSGADGIATFELPRGAKYQIKRGAGSDWQTITIGSGGVTTINSFIGSP